MSRLVIPDMEAIAGKYLRSDSDVSVLGARVAGKTPRTIVKPWIRLTQIDARNEPSSQPEYLIDFMLQLDCYAGQESTEAQEGQAEASLLARTARAALDEMPSHSFTDAVVTCVRFTSMTRLPDPDFEPARERVVLDATVYAHPKL